MFYTPFVYKNILFFTITNKYTWRILANTSKLFLRERLLEYSEFNRCQIHTRNKLMMPDGVKRAASGLVGCIITARYSSRMREVCGSALPAD